MTNQIDLLIDRLSTALTDAKALSNEIDIRRQNGTATPEQLQKKFRLLANMLDTALTTAELLEVEIR